MKETLAEPGPAWVPQPPPPGPRRRRMWPLALLIVVLLLAGGWAFIRHQADQFYAYSPGTAPQITDSAQCRASSGNELKLPNGTPCAQISVPAGQSHGITGSLLMVDVLVGTATPAQYIFSKLGLLHRFEDGTQLIPAGAVLGTTPPAQLSCQDAQEMTDATSSAAVVALRSLGYQVKENDLGAQVNEVLGGSAASAAGLRCNDLVTAVNGAAIHTNADLVAAIRADKPGQTVRVTVRRTGSGGKSQILTLPAHLLGTPASSSAAANPQLAFLGVAASTQTTYSFPFAVNINVGDIGGPSAGLALTLGLLDILSNGDLTGGHRVAATGTINVDGTVGDVGGVAQKTVAVRKAGAQVFLVPPQEYNVAKSEAGPMKVYAVSTLQQALSDLKALGGQIPAASGQTGGG